MPDSRKTRFNRVFCSTTRWLRERAGMTQEEVAEVLEINLSTYKKYETGGPMPHYLVRRFATLCRTTIEEMYEEKDDSENEEARQKISVAAANRKKQ